MATITVTNLNDSGSGSLRDALGLANPGDTIAFDPTLAGGTLHLTTGELDVTRNLTINGDITGNGTPGIRIDGGGVSRVFGINNAITGTLNGLVMVGGYVSGADGGGIAVGQNDSLTVSNSRLAYNSAVYSGSGGEGGAIFVGSNSSLTLLNSTIDHNSADLPGGGIYDASGSVNIVKSTLSSNSARDGGGAYVRFGTLTLVNATLSGNSASAAGGGIFESFSTAKLYDSTLTGNYAAGAGGGIYNSAGGGASVTLANSIVAGNAAYVSGTDLDLDNSPLVLKGNNILGSTPANASSIDTTNGSYTQIDGTSQAALSTVFAGVGPNPHTGVLSGVLADNGGPLRTVAINPAGIAYNAGSNAALPPDTFDLNNNTNTAEPLPVDARGFARVAGGTVDVGAFEQQPSRTFFVTTLADETYDGGTLAQETADGTGLSLREALGLANQDPTAAATITFASDLIGGNTHGVNDGVLLLTNGELTIDSNVTIDGTINGGATPDITIDGQGASRDFAIAGGTEAINPVTLNGLTITGGYAAVDGGGVSLGPNGYGLLDVTISNSIVTNNNAAYGGGISVDNGDLLRLSNSAISGNSAAYVGGGIANKGALQLYGSVVSGNTSGYIGGGIATRGSLTVLNSTIANNRITNAIGSVSYDSAGAGLYNAGEANVVNSTIAGNTGAYAGGGVYNSLGLFLVNATIANNSAYNGGGLYNAACGCGTATLYDSTFTGNYAKQFGGGIHNANGTVTLTNSLVAGNGTGYHGADIENGSGITNYAGVNLFSQAGVGRSGIDIVQPDLTQVFANLTTIDPDNVPNSGDEFAAGTLANNGGSVETVAIKVRGSAQNTGSTADLPPDLFDLDNNGDTSEPLPVDARGERRVFGSAVDIGAVEAQAPPASYDFSGDGKSDLLFQSTGATPQIWLMNGTSVVSETTLLTPPVQWKIVGSGDFDGDGNADILWLNTITNQPGIWEMNGASLVSSVGLTTPPASWRIAGIGDVDGDGKADIIWQNADGTPGIWLMNGTSLVSAVALQAVPPQWRIVGTGDFNGDGMTDFLWDNTSTGQPGIWVMNGTSLVSAVGLTPQSPQMEIIGTGDFNGDGDADILWLDTSTNAPTIWTMNGTSVVSMTTLAAPPSSWRLVGTSDVNGDGKADILWQNADGTTGVWEMNGTSIAAAVAVGNPGTAWVLNNNDPPLPSAVQPGAANTPAAGAAASMHPSAPDTANGTGLLTAFATSVATGLHIGGG